MEFVVTGSAPVVDLAGGRERSLTIDVQVGVDRAINRSDAVKMRLGDLDRTNFLAAEGIGELCGTRAGDVVVHNAAFGSGGRADEKLGR